MLGDRPRRRDLLIEHLHLIQDRYGYLSARASCGARAGDEACAGRGLRGRDVLRPFRRGEGRRDAAAARHRAGLRLALVRDGGRRAAAARAAGHAGPRRPRRARALHGRLRPCAGLRRRSCAGVRRQPETVTAAVEAGAHAHAYDTPNDLAAYRAAGGYRLLQGVPRRQAHARRRHQDGERRRAARARRRRLSDRPQVVAGARRAGAAPVGGQRRRRRARHLQGPLLSRARSAPLRRRHADRRLGDRGARRLHLSARRISRDPPAARARARQGRSGWACPPHPAASAARRRRLHLRRRIRDDRIDRGQARAAAASSALRGAGRSVRPADARTECRDALLGARHRREGRGVVHRARPPRAQGLPQLLGLRPGARSPASCWRRPASRRAS